MSRFQFPVSASTKQKYYDRDLSDPDISSFSNYDSIGATDVISKSTSAIDPPLNEYDIPSIDNLSLNASIPSTGHIKRYKMERKNSQQSQHGKQESFATSGQSTIQLECDPSLLELIGDKEIRVKIADLGNACYNVSHPSPTYIHVLV